MNKKTLLTILQYVVFLGLGVGLIVWQANKLSATELHQIKSAIGRVRDRWWLVIPVIIVGFLSHLFRALRWKILLEPLNLKPTTVNITCAVFIGYLVNLLVPRMGEVARCTVLARYEHEPVDKIIGTIVAERGFDLVCLALFAILTFLLQIDVIGGYTKELFEKLSQKGSSMAIGVGVLVLIIAAMVFIYKRNKRSKVGHFIAGIGDGLRSILKMKKRWLFVLYTALIWGCYLSLIYIGFKGVQDFTDATGAVQKGTGELGLFAGLSVLVFGALGMIATPGGLGAYPPAVQLVLIKLYSINSILALAFGWIAWIAQTGIILVFGVIALLVLPAYNRVPHGEIKVDKG